MPETLRLRVAGALLALLAAWLVSSAAAAAPITVTYEITGGESFGGFLGNAPIQSGTLVITMPNPGSGPPPIRTFAPSFDFQLTATNGATRRKRFGPYCCGYGSASYGPTQVDLFSYFYDTIDDVWTLIRRVELSASVGGRIVSGRFSSGRVYFDGDDFREGVRNLVGQEVSAPEPSSGSLALAALLGLAGSGAGAGIARRLRKRAGSRVAPSV